MGRDLKSTAELPLIRRVRPEDGPLLRTIRLAALLDAPQAFGSRHEEEVQLSNAEWAARAKRGSAGLEAITLFSDENGTPSGLLGEFGLYHCPDPAMLVCMWVEATPRGR